MAFGAASVFEATLMQQCTKTTSFWTMTSASTSHRLAICVSATVPTGSLQHLARDQIAPLVLVAPSGIVIRRPRWRVKEL